MIYNIIFCFEQLLADASSRNFFTESRALPRIVSLIYHSLDKSKLCEFVHYFREKLEMAGDACNDTETAASLKNLSENFSISALSQFLDFAEAKWDFLFDNELIYRIFTVIVQQYRYQLLYSAHRDDSPCR